MEERPNRQRCEPCASPEDLAPEPRSLHWSLGVLLALGVVVVGVAQADIPSGRDACTRPPAAGSSCDIAPIFCDLLPIRAESWARLELASMLSANIAEQRGNPYGHP